MLNLAFLGTLVILSLNVIYKLSSMESVRLKLGSLLDDQNNTSNETESLMEIEELFLYGLAFLESLTLKEYVKSKLVDLLQKKKV